MADKTLVYETDMMAKSPIVIPNEYMDIIRKNGEIEISIGGEKVLRIWDVEGCLEMNEAYNIQKYLPRSWAIGDDEGGYAVIYAEVNNCIGLYAISFSDLDDNEKVFIAPSLLDFLVYGVGVHTFLDL